MSTGLQSLLQETAGLSQELLFEAGLDGRMLVVNPAWATVLGWSETDLQAREFYDLVHPDDLEKTREAVWEAVESATVFAVDARCRGRDGMYRWVSWKFLAREDVLLGAGHDVSALKGAVSISDSARQKAKAVHDINNLMQNIVGALELVRKLLVSGRLGETERFITSAIGAAHRAAELNQQLGALRTTPAEQAAEGRVEP